MERPDIGRGFAALHKGVARTAKVPARPAGRSCDMGVDALIDHEVDWSLADQALNSSGLE